MTVIERSGIASLFKVIIVKETYFLVHHPYLNPEGDVYVAYKTIIKTNKGWCCIFFFFFHLKRILLCLLFTET